MVLLHNGQVILDMSCQRMTEYLDPVKRGI